MVVKLTRGYPDALLVPRLGYDLAYFRVTRDDSGTVGAVQIAVLPPRLAGDDPGPGVADDEGRTASPVQIAVLAPFLAVTMPVLASRSMTAGPSAREW